MKILLLGSRGQLGSELRRTLLPLGKVIPVDFPQIDFQDADSILRVLTEIGPDVVINAAAYTLVDKAEAEKDTALNINAIAVGIIAEHCKQTKTVLIHYSTDYVFDGKKETPYTEIDLSAPINWYGVTKLEGEKRVEAVGGSALTFRTSWVYSLRQGGFVPKVLQLAHQQREMKMVSDQIGSPTWARALAETTTAVLARAGTQVFDWVFERKGLYHLGGKGGCSRFEWTQAILENDPKRDQHLVRDLVPALTADFPTPAVRPLYTVLDCSKFEQVFQLELPDWRTALALALEDNSH